jgi:hypothetical protein
MIADKFIQLMRKVETKTASGEVAWEATAEEDMYQATLGGFIIQISELPGENGLNYRLAIVNNEGRVVESVSSLDFAAIELPSWETPPYQLLKAIFDGARRVAMGADKAIDIILTELEGGLKIEEAKYGAGVNMKDVTDILAKNVAHGQLKFDVCNENLGGDPIPGTEKQLIVTYLLAKRTLSKTVKEKETLRLP